MIKKNKEPPKKQRQRHPQQQTRETLTEIEALPHLSKHVRDALYKYQAKC
jgi:hypothetical protein